MDLEESFGRFSATYRLEGTELVFERRLTLKAVMVPADELGRVRSFLKAVEAAEDKPVVLARRK